MADYIIQDGDQALFLPNFGTAIVTVRSGQIKGSGPSTLDQTKICVSGDEKSVKVPGVAYISGPFVIPGSGTLTILKLANNQVAQKSKTGSHRMLLKGVFFSAQFEVVTPATNPATVADPVIKYFGQGKFKTKNKKFKAN